MRRLNWSRALLTAAGTLFSAGILSSAEREQLWDPPAITVHPDHNLTAKSRARVARMVSDGASLFATKFNRADGAGRPAATGDSKPTPRTAIPAARLTRAAGPDANSCAGCHNQPSIGGSGDFATNVFVGAHFSDPPTLALGTDVTNERNTTTVIGAGAIEMVAREMTTELRKQRRLALAQAIKEGVAVRIEPTAKEIRFGTIVARPDGTFDQSGLEGVDDDLIVKPFGAKGVAVSLREFSIAALNQHHGIEATERFGWERTGLRDFDEDGVENELSVGQVSALVLFQASLLPPQRRLPDTIAERRQLARGERLFDQIGCASCHAPSLPLTDGVFTEPSPFNRPGTATPSDVDGLIGLRLAGGPARGGLQQTVDGRLRVWAYTDLRRHRICDSEDPFFCNERRRQDNVPTDQFMTPKLWDLATSAPYGHRGDCDTLTDVIVHHSGEAAASRRSFDRLPDADKRLLVRFLLSLGAQPVHNVSRPQKERS